MDEIDRNIAVALQEDGSSGLAELAKVAGLSVSATAERVTRREERGVTRASARGLDPRAVRCALAAGPPARPRPPAADAVGAWGSGVSSALGARTSTRPRSAARCSRTSW